MAAWHSSVQQLTRLAWWAVASCMPGRTNHFGGQHFCAASQQRAKVVHTVAFSRGQAASPAKAAGGSS
jgi:hypothetical protein